MNRSNIIAELKSLFADDLSEVGQVIASSISSKENLVSDVSNYLIESGGKRLRPILTLLSSRICGYKKGRSNIFLAAAVELIHGATLLHDDVVDESSSRHNKPTANFAWGNKASILVGDFLFSQSFKLMVKSESMEALQSLSSASAIIAEGEVMQLARLRENKMISIEQYEEIAKAKTAALFGASAHVGAIIAGSDSKIKDAMKDFGILLGLICQITDDMMDYYSTPNTSGKNLGDDLAQGNITAPVILAYNKATQQDKEAIEHIFFNEERAEKFERMKMILDKYDTKSSIAHYINLHYQKALDTLSTLRGAPEDIALLNSLLDYAAFR